MGFENIEINRRNLMVSTLLGISTASLTACDLSGIINFFESPFGLSPYLTTQELMDLEAKQKLVLEKQGLPGNHSLIDLRTIPGFEIQGRLAGGFLSFSGSISGESGSRVQFAWRQFENQGSSPIFISEVPVNKSFFITVDQDEFHPIVNFGFSLESIALRDEYKASNIRYARGGYRIFDSENPNDFLQGDRLTSAKFTLSKKDFADFRN